VPSAQAELSPTARRLLEAARRILERQGYDALTLEAIGREAGENKSLIWYHFGGKPGLLVALVDWILYDQLRELHAQIELLPPSAERQKFPIDYARELASDTHAYRLFYAMLPHLEGDRRTRRRLAGLYADYRRLNAEGLSPRDEPSHDAETLAAMVVAMADGLAIQLMLDPGSVDMGRVVSLWGRLVEAALVGEEEQPRPTG
jgi:AcrR family transcriptional regulator